MTPDNDTIERHQQPGEDELSKAGTAGDQPNDPDAETGTGLYKAVHDELGTWPTPPQSSKSSAPVTRASPTTSSNTSC